MSFYWYSNEIKSIYNQPGLASSPISSRVPPTSEVHPTTPTTHFASLAEERAHRIQNPYERQSHNAPAPKQQAIVASQIMSSPVISLKIGSTLETAWALIERTGRRHIPIVDSKSRPVGMIADRDLFRHTAPFDKANQIANSELPRVDAFMKNRILTALPSTEIRQIARVMLNEHVGAMPIVTELGELVGIITRTDILRTVTNEVPLELWI